MFSFDVIRIIGDIQSFTLENFRIPLDFLRSFFSGNIIYIEINSAILPNMNAL